MNGPEPAQFRKDWNEREALAEAMIPLVGSLYRENNVLITIFSRSVVNRSVIQILKIHRFVRQLEQDGLSITETFPILKALYELKPGPARVDIGKLAYKYKKQGGTDVNAFMRAEMAEIAGKAGAKSKPNRDVVLYGFGRIGRLVARILIEKAGRGDGMRLRAIAVRKGKGADLVKRASLLRRDSVHGPFHGTITIDENYNTLVANGSLIQVLYPEAPEKIDYTEYDIANALLVDNTGVWRDREGLSRHLEAKGVSKVLLTAPGKGDIKNIVHGINHDMIAPDDTILSAASCTTNAITPILKAMNDQFGIEHGHVETIHSYTNDQNLIDNYHKGDRRGRGAPLNMVITETGAATAVAKALPELEGRLTGNSVRVPTPNVSLAILALNLGRETTRDEVNEYLRHVSLHSPLQKQIDYVNSPEVVSSDFVGSRAAGIVDAVATSVQGRYVNLYVWYDNEFGYSCQLVRILEQLAEINLPTLPREV